MVVVTADCGGGGGGDSEERGMGDGDNERNVIPRRRAVEKQVRILGGPFCYKISGGGFLCQHC